MNTFFPQALHTLHAGLQFELEDGTYRELHYDGDIHEANNERYHGRKRVAVYEIGNTQMSYEEAKALIEGTGKQYVLGKRDCWSLIEWFAEKYLGKDKASLPGPIGERNGIGNGVRHMAKKVEKTWMDVRHGAENVIRETTKFFNNPIGTIHEGIKNPHTVVKNVKNAACKVFGC